MPIGALAVPRVGGPGVFVFGVVLLGGRVFVVGGGSGTVGNISSELGLCMALEMGGAFWYAV